MKKTTIGNPITSLPLYPFFLAIFPVVSLLAVNLGQVDPDAGIRPAILSALVAGILYLIFRLVYRNWQRAAFASAGLVFLFYLYGHVYDVISAKWNFPNLVAWMLSLWLALAILALVVAARPKVRFEAAAPALNLISLALLIFPAFQIVQATLTDPAAATKAPFVPAQELHVPQGQTPPDIYYIMPEDYGRIDVLQSQFHIDVSQFMQNLKDMGFYVASCSQSNYVWSDLSLGSALNMEYLQDLDPSFDPKSINQRPIWDAIRYSAVVDALHKSGYKTVAFATGFAWSELDNSDVYLTPSPLWSGLTSFENLLLRTTPARHLEGAGILNLDELDGQRYRERTMLEFNSMERLARMPGPKFVFVHIISPHEPFVFGADGSPIDPAPFVNDKGIYTKDKYIQGYQQQVPFIGTMLEKSVRTLIAESATPPVIILQTDTGPLYTTGSDHFKILNAFYMPGHTDALYSGISSVNTFRVIFNEYFGADYPMLKDASYSSPIPHIYDFTEVPYPCAGQ